MKYSRKAFFFDRDGVLNESIVIDGKPYSPSTMEELQIRDGAADIIKYLKARNYIIIVVTNQPDVKRKKTTKKLVENIHKNLRKKLKFHDLYVSYDSSDNSYFRKPKPGMIYSARKKWNINLKKSYIIGDRNKDILAGLNAGIKTIFINNNYSEKKPIFSHYQIRKLKEIKKFIN